MGLEQVGGGYPDLRTDILSGGTIGYAVWIRNVGGYATHWEGVWNILPQVGPQADREATLER